VQESQITIVVRGDRKERYSAERVAASAVGGNQMRALDRRVRNFAAALGALDGGVDDVAS